jgi:hypothetical protein
MPLKKNMILKAIPVILSLNKVQFYLNSVLKFTNLTLPKIKIFGKVFFVRLVLSFLQAFFAKKK